MSGSTPKSDSCFACLKVDKRRHIIRLVNPTDTVLFFGFRTSPKSDTTHERFKINPAAGHIAPRDFVYVTVENNLIGSATNPIVPPKINLVYWRRTGGNSGKAGKLVVPIYFDRTNDIRPTYTSYSNTFISLLMPIGRSVLLLALVIYNIILIRHVIVSDKIHIYNK